MAASSWWEIAAAYADEALGRSSGNAAAIRGFIALKYDVSAITVARSLTARNFAIRLAGQGRLDRKESVREVPITFMSALARIERLRPDIVNSLLPDAIKGTLTGERLRAQEAIVHEQYANTLPRASPRNVAREFRDGYALRTRSRTFQDRALAAVLLAATALPAKRLFTVGPRLLAFPIAVNAIAVIPGQGETRFRGIRTYSTASADSDRKRVSWALLTGALASRVFHEYFAVFEQEEEARDLVSALAEFGAIGVGVAFLDDDGKLNVALPADRDGPPDLRSRFQAFLEASIPAD